MCKNTVGKLLVVITYVPDPCKTPDTYHKSIIKNDGTLKSVPDYFKNKKCIIKLQIVTQMYQNFSAIAKKLSKYVVNLSILKAVVTGPFVFTYVTD